MHRQGRRRTGGLRRLRGHLHAVHVGRQIQDRQQGPAPNHHRLTGRPSCGGLGPPVRFRLMGGPQTLYFPRAWKVIAGFVTAGLTGLAFYFLPLFQSAATATVNTGPISVPVPNPLPTTTQPFTVLLLGSDDDAKFPQDRVNTQSMILVRVDPGTKQATMLSIPRDLWVTIPGQGAGKI